MTGPTTRADGQEARQWMRRGRSVAFRVNLGWWLHFLLIPALAVGVGFAALILVARAQGWPVLPWLAAAAGAAALAAAGAWIAARRRFFSARDGLVRLEAHARLHNRLSCAAEGVGDWPKWDPRAEAGLGWRWPRILPPLAAALLCLAAAPLVPIKTSALARRDLQEPAAWTQVEEWIAAVEEEKVAAPESLEEIREQLEGLRRQPRENWYSHSSLEAGDQMRDQMQQALEELDRNAALAASTLEQALRAQASSSGSPAGTNVDANAKEGALDRATAAALNREWQKAIEGLKASGIKADPALLKALQGIDPSKLKQLTAAQLKEIQARLAQCQGACATCGLGKNPNGFCLGSGTNALLVAAECDTGLPGMGGISRGRGDAPLTMKQEESQAGSTALEGASSGDLSGAMPGEVVAIQDGRHEVDPAAYRGPEAGGAAAAGGAGEATFRGEVLPEEQAALQKYFKD